MVRTKLHARRRVESLLGTTNEVDASLDVGFETIDGCLEELLLV
jgi:hypothetical protein